VNKLNSITLQDVLETNSKKKILDFKLSLIRYKNMGWIFYKGKISKATTDSPIEIFYFLKNGINPSKNAFPVPTQYFEFWMKRKCNLPLLLPYYQDYFETKEEPSDNFFYSLSIFKGKNVVWFFQKDNDLEGELK
jgi:hypothetical protein